VSNDEFVPRQFETDVFEIMNPRTADDDAILGVHWLLRKRDCRS
jgi:hypothetical protein